MSNPVLVEVRRGNLLESIHRGSIAIADADGDIRFIRGDVQSPVCPRSALKPLQTLALTICGADKAFALSDEEIALACASHAGEPMHVTRIADWLNRLDCVEDDLACGAEMPRSEAARNEMIRTGEKPDRLHNGCSGKHTGFLTLARHIGASTVSYIHLEHPVQKLVAETIESLTGVRNPPSVTDDCTAPNFCLSLTSFARALAKCAGGKPLGSQRIFAAMCAHPELVSGTGQTCARLIRACHGRAVVKNGAEGVYAAMIPELGLGVALKIDDGAMRAAETLIAAILVGLKIADDEIMDLVHAPHLNSRGAPTGERCPAPALTRADLQGI